MQAAVCVGDLIGIRSSNLNGFIRCNDKRIFEANLKGRQSKHDSACCAVIVELGAVISGGYLIINCFG